MSALAQAFYETVQAAASFIAAVPGGVHMDAAPQNEGPPAETLAVYSIVSQPVDTFFGGAKRHVLGIVFEIFGPRDTGPLPLITADGLLFAAAHGVFDTSVTGFDRALIVCTAHGIASTYSDAIGVRSDWTVTGFMA